MSRAVIEMLAESLRECVDELATVTGDCDYPPILRARMALKMLTYPAAEPKNWTQFRGSEPSESLDDEVTTPLRVK